MASQALTVRKVLAAAVIAGSLFPVLPSEATLLPPNSRSQLLSEPEATPSRAIPYVITPERRALLNTIRFAEGTWKGGLDVGYRVMFGGGLMPSMDRHPNRVIYR
ncbi:MAG: endolysin, partial [Synechococcus sp.]|nr:endolysin [Synechococcus sp.]